MPLCAIALFFKPDPMANEAVQVGIEKMMFVFGTVITFLLSIIAFFLIRFINNNDEQMKELRDKASDHETRITVLEKE
jgi:hypothetical protein